MFLIVKLSVNKNNYSEEYFIWKKMVKGIHDLRLKTIPGIKRIWKSKKERNVVVKVGKSLYGLNALNTLVSCNLKSPFMLAVMVGQSDKISTANLNGSR